MVSKGQANNFDSVVNSLQFHVFTDNPDSCVLPFLKRCMPILARKPKSVGGGWTTYPPGPVPIPQDGLLSIKITQHPSLHCKHSGARFDILTQEWRDGAPGIKELRVWFYFDSRIDAEMALKTLTGMFKAVNAEATVMRQSKLQTIILHETGKDAWQLAKLTLRKEKEDKPKYSILFSYGSEDGEPW